MQVNPEQISQLVMPLARVTPEHVVLLGTAFLVGKGQLATTRHVVGDTEQNLVIALGGYRNFSGYQDTSDTRVSLAEASIVAVDPVRDICILRVAGDLFASYKISGSDAAPPGTPLVTFGYPHADHGRMVLTQQNTHVGARVLIDSSGIKSKHIVLNIQTRPGQSGSPVFRPDTFELVGMIIGSYAPGGGGGISLGGVDPHTLHQTTHAISAEYLSGMIQQ